MHRRFTQLIRLSGAAVLMAFVLSGAARAQEVTLKLHHFLPQMSPFHAKFMQPWARHGSDVDRNFNPMIPDITPVAILKT